MGTLYVVATPIGNLEDITKRAIKTLKEVDIILCEDTRHSLKLLNHYEIKNKLISYHKFNETERTTTIINYLKQGKNIALITDAGTPCISDPGYILIKEAKTNNINTVPIGGISALVTALSISGLNTNNFTFYGFFPRETKQKKELIKNIKTSNINTFVFYESPKRIIKTLEYIEQNLDNIKISLSSDLTKLHEKNYYGQIKQVITELKANENATKGEYTFVIEKDYIEKQEPNLSLEAQLIDIAIKNKTSLKEAINILNETTNYKKKDIYNANINLKNVK